MVAFSKEQSYSSRIKVDSFDGNFKWAYLEICEYCSHECPWCYGSFNDSKSAYMSLELFKSIVDKCVDQGILQFTITGGEPTEHPLFKDFILYLSTKNVIVHINTHGEHLTKELISYLKNHNVKQIQFNFQGSKRHDSIHGIKGSFDKQIEGIKNTLNSGIEVTTTTVFGKYNLKEVKEILNEAITLNVNRVRVWETTGVGSSFLKEIDVTDAFKEIESHLSSSDYIHSLSYEPVYSGSLNLHCPATQGLMLSIKSNGDVIYCCAVENRSSIGSIEADNIFTKVKEYNNKLKEKHGIYCEARTPRLTEKIIKVYRRS